MDGDNKQHEQETFDLQSYQRAKELGIDVTLQPEFVWIGHEFSRAGVPEPWSEYSDDHAQVFYYNHESGQSQWVHPLIDTFKALLQKCKEEYMMMPYFKTLYQNLRHYCDEKKGWWALNLLITPGDGVPATPDEVLDMAKYLQLNLKKEPELIWIAKQAVQVPLPPNWEEHEDDDGNSYFYDRNNGKSQLKHPLDDYFFALVGEERKKIPEKRRATRGDWTVGWMPFLDDYGRTYYVSFQYNVQTYYPPWEKKFVNAARIIQRAVRRKQGHQRKLEACATKIQAVYRGHVVRDAVNAWRMECAALCIQTMYRMYRARMESLNERSALIIQSCWRMWVCRDHFLRHRAAVSIQCMWRRAQAMRILKREKSAAKIQSCWRGMLARRRAKVLRIQRDASTVIQAAGRGMLGRKYAKQYKRHRAATLIQSHVRRRRGARLVREERYRQKKESAALTIQTHARRYLAQRLADNIRQELIREAAARFIQKCFRGWEARQYVRWIKHTAAAKVIQRVFRKFIGKVRAQRESAAQHIQRVYRGHKAREWAKLVMSREWDQLNTAVTTIQRTWRGFHARNLYKKTRAAVVVQRFVRGRQQRKRYLYQKAAVVIQTWWKAKYTRKHWIEDVVRMRFLALRLQFLHRMRVSHRQAIVGRQMHEYREGMARRIQEAWKGLKARRRHLLHMKNLHIKQKAALRLQTNIRGFQARQYKQFLKSSYVRIQNAYRTYHARKQLKELKALAVERKKLLYNLRPLYEALHMLPTASTAARRDRLIEQFILQDQISTGDKLCMEANRRLAAAASELCTTCESRANLRDTMISTFRVTWRLINDNSPNRPQIPAEGDPGWISDSVMEQLNREELRLRLIKSDNLPEYLRQAKSLLTKMWDEIPASPSWRKACKGVNSKAATLECLDAVLEELGRMETIRPITAQLSPLLRRRAELKTKRAEIPTPTVLMMDKSAGAEKRKKQAEASIAMLDLEEPRTNRALLNALNDLHKNQAELPVPLEMLKKVTGMPDLAALRAEIAEQANTAPAQVGAKQKKSKMRHVVDDAMHHNDRNMRTEAPKASNAVEAADRLRPGDAWDTLDSDYEDDPNLADKQAKKRPVRRKKKKAVAGEDE